MRTRAFFFAALLLFVFSLLHAQNVSDIVGDVFEETAGSGFVIRTKPSGAKVFIDGVERGQTPFSSNTFRPGDYSVRLSKDGWRDRRFSITLSGRSRLAISIEMEEAAGQVQVSVRRAEGSSGELPFNPIIEGGGGANAGGASSGGVLSLPAGLRTIRVRAFGWQEAAQTVLVRDGFPARVDIVMQPAVFDISGGVISRSRFNPDNTGVLGTTEFRFEVSAPGSGIMSVRDSSGAEVFSQSLGLLDTWQQNGAWNGRDNSNAPLPAGRYAIIIKGEALSGDSGAAREFVLETYIDYSLGIYPLALVSGVSGLLCAPAPAVLPAGSFQIEASLFFGGFSAPERPARDSGPEVFSTLPFEAGFRFAPISRLELNAAFNMNPGFAGGAGFGFTGGAKYVFVNGAGSLPVDIAAAVSFALAQSGGETPLGTGRGGVLYLPMSLNAAPFRILFIPGLRWPGADDPIPRLLLSAGVLYSRSWLTAGVSLRPEFDFTPAADRGGVSFAGRTRIMYGAEIKINPPPSNLVYTVLGGVWQRGGRVGGFGGAGIGLLY